MYVAISEKVLSFLNCVFRYSTECVLGYRCGQFGQRTGVDQGVRRLKYLHTRAKMTSLSLLLNGLFFPGFIHQLCHWFLLPSWLASDFFFYLFIPTGWTRGRGGCQSEDGSAESEGGGGSQPTVCRQPLHCSVSFSVCHCHALRFDTSKRVSSLV